MLSVIVFGMDRGTMAAILFWGGPERGRQG
jgi:hypothetical protein